MCSISAQEPQLCETMYQQLLFFFADNLQH